MRSALVLATLATAVVDTPGAWANAGAAPIRVHDEASGCEYYDARDYEWRPVPGGFARGVEFVSSFEVEAIRDQILAAQVDPPDLLAQLGITPASIAAHRDEIVRAAWPSPKDPTWLRARTSSRHLDDVLAFESIAPHIRDKVSGRNWLSTTHAQLRIEIPGTPPLAIESTGIVPWKLPWVIDDGRQSWRSDDIAVSKAIATLIDRDAPNACYIDGTRYWKDEFWSDALFWYTEVGDVVDALVSAEDYTQLDGYGAASQRFRVERAQTGAINLQPDSLFLEIVALERGPIDGAWWWSPLESDKPTASWIDFAIAFDAASACVAKQVWLADWRGSGPERTIEVHVVGRRTYAERMRDAFIVSPWKHAGCRGDPDVEILLRRKRKWCGTIWLSKDEPGALIATAHADATGKHWFDALEISFHPKEPDYGYVDANGHFELRRMPPFEAGRLRGTDRR